MRVLVASPYPRVDVGGVSSFVNSLARDLPDRGVEVSVVEPGDGSKSRGLANFRLILHTLRPLFMNRRDIDVVHAQQLHPQSASVALLARVLGKGVILTLHGRSPRPKGVRGLSFDAAEWFALRLPNRVVFVAQSLRDGVRTLGDVVPIGVQVELLRRIGESERDQVRSELGVTSSFVLAFVGRVTEDKGIWILADAFRRARSSHPRLKLLVVGPIDEVQSQFSDRFAEAIRDVICVGAQKNPWRYLAASDLFLLPSYHEGRPLSLLEALAMGIPSVATSVGDIPLLIESGTSGWLVPPGDVGALSNAIAEAAENEDLRERYKRAARSSTSLDWKVTLERYLGIYSALYDQRHSHRVPRRNE